MAELALKAKETDWKPSLSLPGYEHRINADGYLETRMVQVDKVKATTTYDVNIRCPKCSTMVSVPLSQVQQRQQIESVYTQNTSNEQKKPAKPIFKTVKIEVPKGQDVIRIFYKNADNLWTHFTGPAIPDGIIHVEGLVIDPPSNGS